MIGFKYKLDTSHKTQDTSGFKFLFMSCVLCFAISLISCSPSSADRVCFKRNCFDVELAIAPKDRQRGMMGRERFEPLGGMFFIFGKEDIYPFWMKDTLIPLDILWLDKDRKVVHIESNVQPCKADPCEQYMPLKKAMYVLELNAGVADDFIIEVGDVAEIKLDD